MISITKDRKLITLINVFTVSPEKQEQLITLLAHATESAVRQVPGFVSASLHRSLDGTKVAMYAQWRSVEDYDAMRRNSAGSPFLQQALSIATFAPGMYEVVDTFTALDPMPPNQSMKPTAPLRNTSSVFATTPCRGLSPSR